MKRVVIISVFFLLLLVGSVSANYVIPVEGLTSTPARNTTTYIGNKPVAPSTTQGQNRVYIPSAGTITMASIYEYSGTAGTAESYGWRLRLNGATDYYIANLTSATNERVFVNTSLSIPVTTGDYFELKRLQPGWVTQPATNIIGGYVYVNTTDRGYPIWGHALTSTPPDSTTTYFGLRPMAPNATQGQDKIYIPAAGTIKDVDIIDYSGTAGTAETYGYRLRKNSATEDSIGNLTVSANMRLFNATLSTTVSPWDYVQWKRLHPAWATNPATNIVGATAYVNMTGSGDAPGYPIYAAALNSNPVDGQTVYIGSLLKASTTTSASTKMYIRESGYITDVAMFAFAEGVTGSAENWQMWIIKNNTETHHILTLANATRERVWSKSHMNIPVVAGDYIEFRGNQPSWGTNPTVNAYGGWAFFREAILPETMWDSDVQAGAPPLSVQFTDLSENRPTSWEWYWFNNETVSSTSQNPSTSFSNGTYSVRLKASNAAGSKWMNATDYITAMDNLVTIRINASYGRTVTHATKGTYSFIRNNPTGTWYDNNYTATDIFPNTSASIAGYPYGGVYRGGLTFNLSAVPSGKPIVAGSINGYLSGKQNTIGNVSSGWIDYNPPNPMSYSYTNDMLRTTFVPYTYYQSYSRLGTANTSVSWKLTPAGIAANNLTNSNNMTSFAISSRWLTENITPDWWKTGGDEGFVGVRSPTYASGQYAPFINITYVNTGDGGSAPVSSFTVEDPVEHFPEPVVVNSTSTESPTAFNWSWGDGTWSNGTSANTTHEYLKRGKFAINLLASNAFGSNMTPAAATVRMVSYEIYD